MRGSWYVVGMMRLTRLTGMATVVAMRPTVVPILVDFDVWVFACWVRVLL